MASPWPQNQGISIIFVYGYASPDGPFGTNDVLSTQRCHNIARYISQHTGIPMNDIRISPAGVAWDGLRALVDETPSVPSRSAVLRILDEYIPEVCTDRVKCEQCMSRLIAIDGGRTYKWLLNTLFPKLRYSLALYPYSAPENVTVSSSGNSTESKVIPETLSQPESDEIPEEPEIAYTEVSDTISSYTPVYRLAIKTNLLYYAALLPNLEAEWLVNDKWSVALEGDVAWWGKYSLNKSYRLAIISPEV